MLGRELPVNSQLPWCLQQQVSFEPLWFWDLPGLPASLQGICMIRVPGSELKGRAASGHQQYELTGAAGLSQVQA